MDMTKVDLNKPAWGSESQKVSELTEAAPIAPSVEEPVEEVKREEEPKEPSEEESKVPYSRFKKFHDEAKHYREEAEMWKAKAEAIKPNPVEEPNIDPAWVKLYGDSPEAVEAWNIQRKREEAIEQRAREAALEAIRNERVVEAKIEEQNLEVLEDHIEQVSAIAGRDLTKKEEEMVLDIIDDYTPKDENGNYVGAMLAPDKAWEIYELKTQASKAPKAKARDAVASLSGSQTQGESQTEVEERNKNFNPSDWGAWRRRL